MYMYVQKHMAIDNKGRTGISCLDMYFLESYNLQLGISMLYFCVLVCSLSD